MSLAERMIVLSGWAAWTLKEVAVSASEAFHQAPSIELEDRLDAVHAQICALQRELPSLIVELDRREAYKVDGARSMSDWVGFRLGVLDRTAREWCASGRSLEGLPAVADTFDHGLLSWDKVRWLTEFVTPDEDAPWAEEAAGASAAEVRAYALHRKRLAREACDARFKRRYLKIIPDVEEGVVRLWGRLPETEGLAVKTAIDRIAREAVKDPKTGRLVPYDQRCADAVVELASLRLGADADPDRATVVCHIDAAELAPDDGVGSLDGGMPVGAETVRRLICNGRLQAMVHDAGGHPIGVGTVSRVVPHYVRRALLDRDGGCAWDGCTATHWLHAHHIIHVAYGGRTDEDNLVMLCGFHHRCVHEGGWRIRGRPGRDLEIVRPDGSPLSAGRVERVGARGP